MNQIAEKPCYKNKHLLDTGAPDGFNTEQCPLFQAQLNKDKQDALKVDIKQILENDDVNCF